MNVEMLRIFLFKNFVLILAFFPISGPLGIDSFYSEREVIKRRGVPVPVPSPLATLKSDAQQNPLKLAFAIRVHGFRGVVLRNLDFNAARGLRGGRPSRAKKPRSSAELEKAEDGSNEDSALEQAALAMTDPFSPKVAGGLSAWGATKQRARRQVMVEEEPQEEGICDLPRSAGPAPTHPPTRPPTHPPLP